MMNALRHMADQPSNSGRNALSDLAEMLRQQGQVSASGVPDEYLVHINRREYEMLDRETDGASINPATGLPQFLEGDSGGVSDTGGHSSGGPNSNGSGPMGGENAATGAAFGSTADRDAAYGGGWGNIGGGIGDLFTDPRAFIERNYPANIATPGLIGTMVSAVAPGVGLAMQAGPAVAEFAGNGITSLGEAISGEKASSPPGSVDYGQSNNGVGGAGGMPPSGPSIGSIPLSLGGSQNALAQMGRRNTGTPFFVGSIPRGW